MFCAWPIWRRKSISGCAAATGCADERARSSRHQRRIVRRQRRAVLGAEEQLADRATARAIHKHGCDLLGPFVEFLTPLAQRDQDGKKAAAFRRQHVVAIGAAIGGWLGGENAAVDQRPQTHGQDVLGHSEAALKAAEAANAEKC